MGTRSLGRDRGLSYKPSVVSYCFVRVGVISLFTRGVSVACLEAVQCDLWGLKSQEKVAQKVKKLVTKWARGKGKMREYNKIQVNKSSPFNVKKWSVNGRYIEGGRGGLPLAFRGRSATDTLQR